MFWCWMGKLSPRVTELGQLRVLHSYLCGVSQRTRVLQLSRTLRGLKAKARPGKVAFISSFVSDPLLSMNQEGPHSNSRCCTARYSKKRLRVRPYDILEPINLTLTQPEKQIPFTILEIYFIFNM